MPNFRAIEAPLAELQPDPVATDIILGTPHPREYPGARILMRKPVEFKYRWWEWDLAHLKAVETERPLRAPLKTAEFHSTSHTGQLKRYGLMSIADDDEFDIAVGTLALRQKHGVFARDLVNANLERLRRDAILNASYPSGHVITLASGDEFDSATGGSLAPVQAGLNLIASKTGWNWNQIEVFLPYDSYVAAITDPTFRSERKFATGTNNPTTADLQAYWGSGPVWTMNTLEATDAGVVQQMWGDVAILYGPGVAPEMDTEFGYPTFGRRFGWTKAGIANVPQRLALPLTGTGYPWTDYEDARILVPSAGVKIVNCKA